MVQQVKRLRKKIRDRATRIRCIAIRMTNDMILSMSVTRGMEQLISGLISMKQRCPILNADALHIIETVLPAGQPQPPLTLFPKDQDVTHWYYHIYATKQVNDD